MFGHRFWGNRFFGSHFWGPAAGAIDANVSVVGQQVTIPAQGVTVVGKAIVVVTETGMTASVGSVTVTGVGFPVSGQFVSALVGSVTVKFGSRVNVTGQAVTAQVGSATVLQGVTVLIDMSGTGMVMPAPFALSVTVKFGSRVNVSGQSVTAFVGSVITHYAYKVFLTEGFPMTAYVGRVTSPNWGTIPDSPEFWTGVPPGIDEAWTAEDGSGGSGWTDEREAPGNWADVVPPGNNWTPVNG